MQHKKSSSKMIPPDYSIGKNVFPVVPFRTQLQVLSAGINTNVAQDVELDLDFESNEVFDVLAIDTLINVKPNLTAGDFNEEMNLALTDDPDKPATTRIDEDITANTGEATFEGDESFVYYHDFEWSQQATTDTMTQTTSQKVFIFEQPWTVSRNIRWIFSCRGTAAGLISTTARIQLWGRRRNASDTEFKAIIYRQRF